MTYQDMESLFPAVAKADGGMLEDFTEELFGRFTQKVVHEDDNLQVNYNNNEHAVNIQ
jgi:hypothetical protein